MGALPNLLIIGAMKCGTTSLHHYLDLHPEISMSDPKEVRFFDDPAWEERIDWYRDHFDPDAPVRGEASVYYSAYPWIPDVPQRIHSLVPDARLIYMVGDPIKRLSAQWAEWCEIEADQSTAMLGKWARKPFDQVLSDFDDPGHPVVCPSRYATQLEQYLALFPPEQVLVVDQHDLKHNRLATLVRIFQFLQVDDSFVSPEFTSELNTHGEKRRAFATYSAVRKGLLRAGAKYLPEAVRRPLGAGLRSRFSRPLVRPEVDESLLPGLKRALKDETDRLRALTGMEFPHWSV
jgi:sulfotransferase family protein